MQRLLLLFTASLILSSCATPGPPTRPNDREWNLIAADYQWIDTLRKAQPAAPANATRRQQIELALSNLSKIQATWTNFVEKASEYYKRTGDPRAASLIAREKMLFGDLFLGTLSRYEQALEYYRQALELEPGSTEIRQRIAAAEQRRFVSMNSFAGVKNGMKEDDVRRLVGLPREDWIKQVVQNNRVFSVWIYPKSDGGASAIYFDNGVVYHTNWNAASPTPQSQPSR